MNRFIPILVFLLLAAPAAVFAANATKPAAEMPGHPSVTVKGSKASGTLEDVKPVVVKPSTAPPPESMVDKSQPFRRSFFLSPEDLMLIDKAARGVIVIPQFGSPDQAIPQIRRIVLSGILYKSPDDWKIWLNGQKVTPWVQPREVHEIKVEPDVVHLKWFDIGANAVLTLDMRPNEIYDIVTGVSLPDQAPVKPEKPKKGGKK